MLADSNRTAIARMTHRYAYVNTSTGRPVTPEDWPAIVEAVRAYEADVEVSDD